MEYCDECIWVKDYTAWGTPTAIPICMEECLPSGQLNNEQKEINTDDTDL